MTLDQLPPPPKGRTGWPWTEAPPHEVRDDCASITIVTPSFNQGAYLEETIRSIVLQGYPRLQYIVLDGGSTDHSVAILGRYSAWITHWRSEPDQGQADAIARGLAQANGEIVNWINSDDVLQPGALATVDLLMRDADVVAGVCINMNADGTERAVQSRNLDAKSLLAGSGDVVFQQPATWFRRTAVVAAGGLDRTLHYVFDWELLIRVLAHSPRVVYSSVPLARFRLHAASKTVTSAGAFELERRRATRLLSRRLSPGEVRKAAVILARRQRWWQVLAALRRRYGDSPRTAVLILRAVWRDPRSRFSRLTFGSVRRALFRATAA